jgi:hypothetical protein
MGVVILRVVDDDLGVARADAPHVVKVDGGICRVDKEGFDVWEDDPREKVLRNTLVAHDEVPRAAPRPDPNVAVAGELVGGDEAEELLWELRQRR